MIIAVITCDKDKFHRFKNEIAESIGLKKDFRYRNRCEFTTKYDVTYKMIKHVCESRSIAFSDYIVWDVPDKGANDIFKELNRKIQHFGFDKLI